MIITYFVFRSILYLGN